MNTTDKLAEVLRRVMNESADVPAGFDAAGATWWAQAHRALAEYDAARAEPERAARGSVEWESANLPHVMVYPRKYANGWDICMVRESDGKPSWTVCQRVHSRETADRIVACVNACAGIPTDALVPGYVAALREHADDMEGRAGVRDA